MKAHVLPLNKRLEIVYPLVQVTMFQLLSLKTISIFIFNTNSIDYPDSMTTLGQRSILVSRFVGSTLINYFGPMSTFSLGHRRANALE